MSILFLNFPGASSTPESAPSALLLSVLSTSTPALSYPLRANRTCSRRMSCRGANLPLPTSSPTFPSPSSSRINTLSAPSGPTSLASFTSLSPWFSSLSPSTPATSVFLVFAAAISCRLGSCEALRLRLIRRAVVQRKIQVSEVGGGTRSAAAAAAAPSSHLAAGRLAGAGAGADAGPSSGSPAAPAPCARAAAGADPGPTG